MRKDRNILCIFAEYMSMKFILQHKDPSSHARAGELHTDHGVIRTPIFMPVGTKANVKGIPTETVKQLGAQIVLANTYHLSMRPGEDTIAELGGTMPEDLPTPEKSIKQIESEQKKRLKGNEQS